LDIGCGTGEILAYLPEGIIYHGYDMNPHYIADAQKRFGDRGKFVCQRVSELTLAEQTPYDHVLAFGLIHHLQDAEASDLFTLAKRALKPSGVLVTIDPCYTPEQSALARWMVSRDRGDCVRTPQAYQALALSAGFEATCDIHHDLIRLPYTHCILRLLRP
jgi:cyclopropane fatty-acyl-phospholipid synthase-like methyltransferase